MRKLYENFHIFHFQKRIVSAETIRGKTVTQTQIKKKIKLPNQSENLNRDQNFMDSIVV